MKVPEIIKEGKRKYKFIKKCNDILYLYQETTYGYKKCFTKFDLGFRTEQIKVRKVNLTKHL